MSESITKSASSAKGRGRSNGTTALGVTVELTRLS